MEALPMTTDLIATNIC